MNPNDGADAMAKKSNSDEKPKLKLKQYQKELQRLQAELCYLQD